MRCARFDYEKISKMLNREVSARTARRIHTHSLERIRDKVYLKAIEESKKNTGLDGLYMPIDLDMIGEVTPPSMLIIQPINSYA